MSYSNLLKVVNSNYSEPLNFALYLTDIVKNGKDSYMFTKNNRRLFRQMLIGSEIMMGHTGIHDVLDKNISREDAFYMIVNCKKLGKMLGLFYDIRMYNGGIDNVLPQLTVDNIKKISPQFIEAFSEYIDMKLNSDLVGEWLANILDEDYLLPKQTFDDIFNDEVAMDKILTTDLGKFILALSNTYLKKDTDLKYTNQLVYQLVSCVKISEFVLDLQTQNEKLDLLFKNESIMAKISESEQTVEAIIGNEIQFKAFTGSDYFVENFVKGETLFKKIIDAYNDCYCYGETIGDMRSCLQKAKKDANTLLDEGTCKFIEDSISECNDMIEKIDVAVTNRNNMIVGLKGMFTKSCMVEAFKKMNKNLMCSIFGNSSVCNSFIEDGSLKYYATNCPDLLISKMLYNTSLSTTVGLRNEKQSLHQRSYSNNSYDYIITMAYWLSGNNLTTAVARVTASNYYDINGKYHSGTDYIHNKEGNTEDSWFSQNEDVILVKRGGTFNLNIPSSITNYEIDVYVIK